MIGWHQAGWAQQVQQARETAQAHQQARYKVDLKKLYRQGDLIYSPTFKPPAVPRFGNTNNTGEHSG